MKFIRFSLLTVLGIAFAAFPFALNNSSQAAAPERLIVVFEDGANLTNSARAVEAVGANVLRELPIINGLAVAVSERASARLSTLPGVERVDVDARVYAIHHRDGHDGGPPGGGGGDDGDDGGSDQPAENLEWGVNRIDADLAWGTSRGTAVEVAVIDTGIDKDHADLVDNISGGVNFVANGPSWKQADPEKWDDDNGHGTHVAGIIAAVDNEIGVIGVAPEADLYGVKVLDRNGSGYLSDVIAGIDWSVKNNMQVINMSLGTASDVQSLEDAVNAAYDAGLVVVAAAGNSGDGNDSTNDVNYPARYASVIAIAATAEDDSTPSWSSEGEEVELAAPGVSVRSTWNDGLYNTISGTSMASPHAAGVAALIIAADPTALNTDVRNVMTSTAEDLGTEGFDNFFGNGLVDAEGSVN